MADVTYRMERFVCDITIRDVALLQTGVSIAHDVHRNSDTSQNYLAYHTAKHVVQITSHLKKPNPMSPSAPAICL